MGRLFAAILLIVVLAVGGGIIATSAYQAGLDTAITTSTVDGAVVAPVVIPAYGAGWHGVGFGVFALFGTLLFLFVVFGLLRLLFFRGMGHRHGWAGSGPWGGPGGWGRSGGPDGDSIGPWEGRARETFDAWHRLAHDHPAAPPDAGAASRSGSSDPA
jgi:hypothetical protein